MSTPEIYTLSLHDALPISSFFPSICDYLANLCMRTQQKGGPWSEVRSEEHTSELQSRFDLVCRLLLEKKNTSIKEQRTVHNGLQIAENTPEMHAKAHAF